jgi:hypothetical protein
MNNPPYFIKNNNVIPEDDVGLLVEAPCSRHCKSMLATCFTLVSFLAYSSTLKTEAVVPPKLRLTFNGLHGVISQKIEILNNI